jgi:hypothetical protein
MLQSHFLLLKLLAQPATVKRCIFRDKGQQRGKIDLVKPAGAQDFWKAPTGNFIACNAPSIAR